MPLTLSRAARSQRAGEPLPKVFARLWDQGIRPRQSEVTLWFGLPGAAKTATVLIWLMKMNVPALYFSLDTDSGTMERRAVAHLSGKTVELVETEKKAGHDFSGLLESSKVRYCFTPDMTMEEIDLELRAYVEIHGAYPQVIVIDNLMDMSADGDNEWSGMRQLMKGFHSLARVTQSGVWVLHHASEGSGSPFSPPPRKEIQGKLAQKPGLIISLCCTGEKVGIACVKNRHGKADPTGQTATWFNVDLSRMRLYENSFEGFAEEKRREWV